MISNRNIDQVLLTVKRLTRQWKVPVVTRYRHDPFRTLVSCLLTFKAPHFVVRG